MKTRVNGLAGVVAHVFLLALLVLGVLPVAAHAAAAAMVIDLQGKATLTDAGRTRDATILAELEAGAQVQLQAGATLVVMYLDSGDEYVFKGPASIVFRPAEPELLSGPRPDKRSPSVGKGIRIKPVGMAQGAIVLRSLLPGARIRLLTLSGTRVLESPPEFRWQELQPGLKYQFGISDDTGRSLHEATVEGSSLVLPPGVQLGDGASYQWEVSTRLPDGRKYSNVGVFSIASAELRALAAALRTEASAPVSARVAYAAWLDQMELKDDARRYWRTLSTERPDDARLRLLAQQ